MVLIVCSMLIRFLYIYPASNFSSLTYSWKLEFVIIYGDFQTKHIEYKVNWMGEKNKGENFFGWFYFCTFGNKLMSWGENKSWFQSSHPIHLKGDDCDCKKKYCLWWRTHIFRCTRLFFTNKNDDNIVIMWGKKIHKIVWNAAADQSTVFCQCILFI